MELSFLIFTGSLSALVSILGHSVLWSLVEWLGPRRTTTDDRQVQIVEAFLHMFLGIVLGAMFWLSWGLAAIVDVAWWTRGLIFGLLAAAVTLPPLLNALLAKRFEWTLALVFGSRWLSTCVITSLGCAWTWQKSA